LKKLAKFLVYWVLIFWHKQRQKIKIGVKDV